MLEMRIKINFRIPNMIEYFELDYNHTPNKNMDHYRKIIGKTKVEVLKELGDEFNFFPNNVWTYCIKNKWWQKKKTLYVFFEHDIVKNITIK